MKRSTWMLVGALLLISLLLAACSGPQGPAGPMGPAGPQGPAGAVGPAGKDASAPAGAKVGADYAGSKTCLPCHKEIGEAFAKSGHAYKLTKVVDGKAPSYPFTKIEKLPEGYTWNDISYVIGGYNWKARFMDKKGYIITDQPGATVSNTKYLNQWNFANSALGKDAGWTTYNAGAKELKYNCGPCHMTGYSPSGSQGNLPGIVGTWAEDSITCEECHGPGSSHVTNPRGVAMKVDRDSEQCGQCHRRGDVTKVDAKDGFIEHHEQYEELYQGKHVALNCVLCHDPHNGVVQLRQAKQPTTRTSCEACHWQQAAYQDSPVHGSLGVTCIDCHMPRIVKSAWGDAAKNTGDIRTHLMAIDPNQVGQFSKDGKAALSQISLDFACKHCHVQGGKAGAKADDALKARAQGYHTRP